MRYSKFILFTLVSMLLFTSCEDFLKDDPESVLLQDGFYNTPENIEVGIVGCYTGMKWPARNEWKLTEIRTDNTNIAQLASAQPDRVQLNRLADFTVLSSETVIYDYWYDTYQNISNINSILPSVDPELSEPIMINEVERARAEGELRFMRAYHYFMLTNLFGDVIKVTTVVGPEEAKGLERSPVSEIAAEIIIPDLEVAIDGLPEEIGTGRLTKWAAQAMLAKVYMQLGGSSNLAAAKALLSELVVSKTSPHSLLNNYMDIFSTSNEMNDEIIFAVRFRGNPYFNGSPFWYDFASSEIDKIVPVGSSRGDNNPTWELVSHYRSDTSDSRKDGFGMYKGFTDSMTYVTKYVDPDIAAQDQGENDLIVIRYADLVLLYAEILAQDGNYAGAYTYVNQIRARAGKTLVAAPFTSATMALDSVYYERRLELAFENQRWFDLLRMNTSYGDPNKAMDIIRTHVFDSGDDWDLTYSLYEKVPIPVRTNFINSRLLLPIPQTEIDISSVLDNSDQNPGY